jgi:YHS domain-containing protein
MKKHVFATLFLVLVVFTMQSVFAQKAETKQTKEKAKTEQTKAPAKAKADAKVIWNKVCPVMGNAVSATAPTVEYKGKTIGFCCAGCDAKFKKDPETYMKNLSPDGAKFVGKK